MLKNLSKLECKIGERIYQFLCDTNSPTVEVKEAFFQFSAFIAKIEEIAKQEQEKSAPKEEVCENPPEVQITGDENVES